MNKTTTSLFLLFYLVTLGLFAQNDTPKPREIGIRLSGLNDFDFIYKKQKAENKYTRLRLISGNFSIADFENFNSSFSLGLTYGKETRIYLKDNFSFVKGWEIIGSVGSTTAQQQTTFYVSPGLGMVLGFQYDVNENFSLTIETIPILSADLNINSNSTKISNFNLGFNSNSIALGIMYKF